MALFAVSFKLEDGSDYKDRYAALTEAIEAASEGDVWSETSSFYLITSTRNSATLKDSFAEAANLQDGDVLLVLNLSKTKGHATSGISKKSQFTHLVSQR